MLIKFFPNGRGGGDPPVNYLTAATVLAYDASRALMRDEAGCAMTRRREPLPEVLAGDPERTRLLIDACPHQWSYRSGVISFAAEDTPDEAQQRRTIAAFEDLAFAGLERDQVDMLWVRHRHEGRVELHFLTPRMELGSGKSLNIAPPGYRKAMDALRDVLNKTYGWADPEDPARARDARPQLEAKVRAQGREEIQHWLEDLTAEGRITDRKTMLEALESAGFNLPRQGKAYLTVEDPDSGTRWRLKGEMFHADWTREKTAFRALEREHGEPAPGADRSTTGAELASTATARLAGLALADLRARLAQHLERRASYNRKRYPHIARGAGTQAQQQLQRDAEQEPERTAAGGERSSEDPSAEPQATGDRGLSTGPDDQLQATLADAGFDRSFLDADHPGGGDGRRQPPQRHTALRGPEWGETWSEGLHGPLLRHKNGGSPLVQGERKPIHLQGEQINDAGLSVWQPKEAPSRERGAPADADTARARVADLGRAVEHRLRANISTAESLGRALNRLADTASRFARNLSDRFHHLSNALRRSLGQLALHPGSRYSRTRSPDRSLAGHHERGSGSLATRDAGERSVRRKDRGKGPER